MKRKKKIFVLVFILILFLIIKLLFLIKKDDEKFIYANIANWSFNLKNSETAINLSNEKIAPGSSGEFEIKLDAAGSDVNVEYNINVIEEKNIPSNMNFIAEIKDAKGGVLVRTEEYKSFSELAKEKLKGEIQAIKGNQERIIKVYWNWPLNSELKDETDNESGNLKIDEQGNSSLNCYIKIQIIGKQA